MRLSRCLSVCPHPHGNLLSFDRGRASGRSHGEPLAPLLEKDATLIYPPRAIRRRVNELTLVWGCCSCKWLINGFSLTASTLRKIKRRLLIVAAEAVVAVGFCFWFFPQEEGFSLSTLRVFFFFFSFLFLPTHAGYFLRLFISIPTPDTGIRLGSVALREHFHTLIFVCTVSCSTRRLWTAGLLYMRKRVGCQKAQFHSRDFASGYMCSVLRHEMAHVWMCAYIHVCVCPNFILMLFFFVCWISRTV